MKLSKSQRLTILKQLLKEVKSRNLPYHEGTLQGICDYCHFIFKVSPEDLGLKLPKIKYPKEAPLFCWPLTTAGEKQRIKFIRSTIRKSTPKRKLKTR